MKKIKGVIVYLVIFLVFLTSFFSYKYVNKQIMNKQKEYKCVITVWHVDTFSGGTGSRSAFLRQVATSFSKKYPDVLFLVTSYTKDSVEENIKNGEKPHLISYGGCGFTFIDDFLKMQDYPNIKDGASGDVNRYAVSWCKGGYFEIVKGNGKNVIIEDSLYNNVFIPLILSNKNYQDYDILTESESVSKFVSSKDATLIATQRSVMRLKVGGYEFNAKPFEEFNDLFQYISILKGDGEVLGYINLFIDYLLSEDIQKTLSQISMLSVIDLNIYNDNVYYSELEKVNNVYTISPFLQSESLKKVKNDSKNAFIAKENEVKIANYLKRL